MKTRVLIAGIVILSLLTMGCSVCSLATRKGKEAAATKVIEKVERIIEEQATETQVPDKTKDPEPTKPSKEDGSGAIFDGEQVASLDSLDSYRYELEIEANEVGNKTTMSGGGAYIKEPLSRQVELQIDSSQEGSQILRFILVGGAIYIYDQDREGWMALDGDSPLAVGLNIVDLMMDEMIVQFDKSVFKLVDGHEQTNAVDCSHYRVAAKEVEGDFFQGEGEITDGTIDVWIANALGVVIKYDMTVEGKDKDGNPVDAVFVLNVLDVNKPVSIEPPPESEIVEGLPGIPGANLTPVPGGGDGIAKTLPKPDDTSTLEGVELAAAQALAESADSDMYKISLSIDEAVKFYEQAYSDAGWTKMTSPPVMEGVAVLIFGRDGKTATVMINSMFSPDTPMVVVFVQ